MYRTDKIKERPTTWKEFVALTKKYGKTTMVDSSPEVVGSIATMLGYSYNTEKQSELDQVQQGAARPQAAHRRAPLVELRHAHRQGPGLDGPRLERRRAPALATKLKGKAQYVVAKEGGEIWIDYYNIPVGAANPEAAHAWINFVYSAADRRAGDVVLVLRLSAQAVAAQGHRGRCSC